jgi:predicted acylesterase/phospholipase RssA/CRP-like cAMP-binding protein
VSCTRCGREDWHGLGLCDQCSAGAAVDAAMASGELDLRRARLAAHLRDWVGDAGAAVLADLEAAAQWVSLRGGQTLFRRGDAGDAAYILINGRLRVVQDEAVEQPLADIALGETVGEMALLSSERRSATVYAVRDSVLARLSADSFRSLVERHPRVLQRISALLVQRLRRRDLLQQAERAPIRTIGVVPVGNGPGAAFALGLARALALHEHTLHVSTAHARRSGAADGVLTAEWLNQQELSHRFVVYEADPGPTEWTLRAVRQSDHVVFVADARATGQPGDIEAHLAREWSQSRAPRCSLVLTHATGELPATQDWLRGRHVGRHYHVDLDSQSDFQRLARCLTGRGIGLVLGGGGARGFAHLGVLRALEEAGVPVDWIGGTSSGAIIGALAARRVPHAQAQEQCRRDFSSLWDPTLPLLSLLTGRRVHDRLQQACGTLDIEDLPLPFFCVSTNLSRSAQVVHERGSLSRAIRASLSLPGVLPPVSIDGDLHVDGGLVNNLPVDIMRARPEIGTIIAVDVSPDVEMSAPPDLPDVVSGWQVLGRRIGAFPRRDVLPGIMTLLARSSVVASAYWTRERRTAQAASLYLRIPVADLRLMAFDRVDEIAQRGYEWTREKVRLWWGGQKA